MNFDKNTLYFLVEITVPDQDTVIRVYTDIEPRSDRFTHGKVFPFIHSSAPPPSRVSKKQPLTAKLFVTTVLM